MMLQRILTGGMLFAVLAMGSGCCSTCYQGRQTVLRSQPIRSAIRGCERCGDTQCDGNDCGPRIAYSPLDHLRQLPYLFTCGTGCGEVYWGEWTSDPPQDPDPCYDCGNRAGPRPFRSMYFLQGWRNMWGYRYNNRCRECGVVHEQGTPHEVYQQEGDSTTTLTHPQSVLRHTAAGKPYYVPKTASRQTNYTTR